MSKTYNIRPDSDYVIDDYELLSDKELDFHSNGNRGSGNSKSRLKSSKNATRHRRHEISGNKRLPNGWEAFDYGSMYDDDIHRVH